MSNMKEELKIFKEIEQDLTMMAKKCQIQDPKGFATSWFLRMHEILEKWETGDREKKYFVTKGRQRTEHILPDDLSKVTPAELALFHESRKHYLKMSFKRDAIKEVKFNPREIRIEPNLSLDTGKQRNTHSLSVEALPSSHPPEAYSLFPELTLSDLIEIVKKDISRQQSMASSVREKVNFIFLQCILKFYKDLMADEGNISITQRIESDNVNDFFDRLVRKNETIEIAKELKVFFERETHYGVKLRLKGILDSKKNHAIRERISRYLSNMYGGMPVRLKKRLEGRRNNGKETNGCI